MFPLTVSANKFSVIWPRFGLERTPPEPTHTKFHLPPNQVNFFKNNIEKLAAQSNWGYALLIAIRHPDSYRSSVALNAFNGGIPGGGASAQNYIG